MDRRKKISDQSALSQSPGKSLSKDGSSPLRINTSPQVLRHENNHRSSPQPVMRSEWTPELERSKSPENFFNFSASNDVDIWGNDITAHLKRKMSLIRNTGSVASPLQSNESVQNIGTAFVGADVDVTRRSKSPPVVKQGKKGQPLPSPETSLLERIVELAQENEDLKSARWEAPSICETIDRILVGKSYCLDWYKSHLDKIALLDAAIATNDGNCIMAVLLFIRKSVSQPILLGMLQKRSIALRHYASYLKQLGGITELINLYKRLNENEKLADLKIQQCEAVMSPSERCSKIKECHTLFTSSPELKADARHLEDYARLTQMQRMIEESEGVPRNRPSLLFRSMVTTLLYCCRYHRRKAETNTASPVALCHEFNIAEKQYFQVYLVALCLNADWNAIEALVTTKGFFSKKKKSPIGFERVVKTIARKSSNPPLQILTKYLAEVDDLELRLQLATEVSVYDVGLDCLKQLRDRERVRGYISVIPVRRQPEYRKKIESLLTNSHIKWK